MKTLLLLVSLLCLPLYSSAADRPNFVVIFTDDQGWNDVGCFGSEIPTPHIDRLAKEGVRFEQWYSASSICTPSRYGLLTGHNPSRSRDRLLGALMFLADEDKGRGIHPGETTLPSVLRKGGYSTHLVGKWHLGHGGSEFLPTRHGFDSFYGHTGGCVDFYTMRYGLTQDWYSGERLVDADGYATDLLTQEAVRVIENQKQEKPFFLLLAYNAPHFGKGWNDGKDETVNLLQPHPRDMARVRHITDITRRKYAAKVVGVDDGVGQVLAALRQANLDRNTLVLFLTDHGGDPNYGGSNIPYREGKATLFEGGIRVPAVLRWPAGAPAGRVAREPVSTLDLFPTFCELAEIDARPYQPDGYSLAPLLTLDLPVMPGREFFWELGSHAELERGQWLAYRKDDWKYVQTPDGTEHLFQIRRDPFESENLASQDPLTLAHYRARVQSLTKELRPKSNSSE